MGKIIELSPQVYNRIAAGEVIENPASVVKELLENSLDAESTKIKIIIKQSGKKEISVIDNGIGMEKDDLYLAIKKHTTSKIRNVKDLNRIKTLGFRGEALSSIVSVAIVEISSKTKQSPSGIKLVIENTGKDINQSRAGMNKGTSIKVANLFYNTPARFKFLKGDRKELLKIKELINKIIISNFNIDFQLIYENDKPVIYKPQDDILKRIKDIYGKEFCEELIFFKKKTPVFSIYGYISKPSFNKSNRNYQFLFLNQRPINTDYFNYWISMGYENLIVKKRYPIAFIFIDAPPDFYDVNVHPAKQEVRFVNEYQLGQTLISTVKDVLNKNLLIPNIKKESIEDPHKKYIKKIDNSIDKFLLKHGPGKEKTIPREDKKEFIPALSEKEFTFSADYITFFNTYILYEDKESGSVYIIDQHAAHERILYEKLKRSIEEKEDIFQNLLMPINLELSSVEYQVVMDNKNVFRETGYNIEDFGNNSVIINSVPSYIEHKDDKQLFLDILSDLMENKKINKTKLKDEILKSLSCKAAIKAGEKLNIEEIEVLLKDLLKVEARYTCPHGRPAVIQLNKDEIEKWFKRR